MKCLNLTAILLVFSMSTAFAADVQSPKFSDVKRLTDYEVQQQLLEFTGTRDTWKNNISLRAKLKNYLPFKKKTTLEEERLALTYLHASKNPQSLQQVVLAAQNSRHPEIRGMTYTILGDKALVKNTYSLDPHQDLRYLLYFFRTLQAGDTGIETKKFNEFALALEHLSYQIKSTYQQSAALNFPMILEFESSALSAKSPLTRMFFNAIVSNNSQVLKVEITPSGGRIVSIHPFYARKIAQNWDLFTDQFTKKVKTLRGRLFQDPEAKIRMIELLRDGKGLSGVFYTDERILELVLQEKRNLENNCAKLFR